MKRKLAVLLTAVLVFTMAFTGSSFAAAGGISVTVDTKPVTFDQAPINVGGMVFVPIRGILEAFGQKVEWDNISNKITATDPVTGMITTLHTNNIYVQTEQKLIKRDYELVTSPIVVGGRTLIPVRAVSEIFNKDVKWNQATQTVAISSTMSNLKTLSATADNTFYLGDSFIGAASINTEQGGTWKMGKNNNVIWTNTGAGAGQRYLTLRAEEVGTTNLTLEYVNDVGYVTNTKSFNVVIKDPTDIAQQVAKGGAVNAKVGSYVKFTLKENKGTGYSWYATAQPQGMQLVERKTADLAPENGLIGTPQNVTYVYKVTAPGSMTIQMSNMRSWSGETAETAKYTINAIN